MTTANVPASPRVATYDYALFGAVEIKPLNTIRKVIAARLQASWTNVPHVAHFDEVDITTLEALRRQLRPQAEHAGGRLTALAFIIKACGLALKAFPDFNASLDETGHNLVLKKYCHIAFAVDTPDGLLAPVIRDIDKKSVFDIAEAVITLSEKARTKRLAFSDVEGGCFSVTNLGKLGGTGFVPIINAPEVAILGVGRAAPKPMVGPDGAIAPKLMMPLSLVYDHRVVDGAAAGRFMEFLCDKLTAPRVVAA